MPQFGANLMIVIYDCKTCNSTGHYQAAQGAIASRAHSHLYLFFVELSEFYRPGGGKVLLHHRPQITIILITSITIVNRLPQFGAYLTIVIYDCKTCIVQATIKLLKEPL